MTTTVVVEVTAPTVVVEVDVMCDDEGIPDE